MDSKVGTPMWRQSESGRVEHPFEPIVLAATLLIPVIIIERDAESDGWVDAAFMANWIIWTVFAFARDLSVALLPRQPASSAHRMTA